MRCKSNFNKLTFASLNSRGLGDQLKRKKMFKLAKEMKAEMIFFQETHCTKDKEKIWRNEWGNDCVFSNGDSASRGVAIMFRNKMSKLIKEIRRDIEGRFIIMKLEIEGYTYCVCNLYAPNEDRHDFFENIFDIIREMDCIHVIIGGDFNVVLDPKLDRNTEMVYHKRCHQTIKDFMDAENLSDVWRNEHPDKKHFTWVNRARMAWSRIDYFLVSHSLLTQCNNSRIVPSICSDHSIVKFEIAITDIKRGPGNWKMNDKLLLNNEYVEEMSNILKGTIRTYNYCTDTDLWELLKFESRQWTRYFASNLQYQNRERKFELYKELEKLQDDLIRSKMKNEKWEKISAVTAEIDAFVTVEAKKAAFRCKKDWVSKGEMPTSYFFNLEKRNYLNKAMLTTRREDNTLTKDYREILDIQYKFYERLYDKDKTVKFNLINTTNIKLTPQQKIEMDLMVSKDELFDAMMTLKRGKCPGLDGLSIAFYHKFWNILLDPLYNMYIESIRSGKLNPTGRRGLINLIPKGGQKDETYVKNWRPIVTLNYDCKIWSKALANRLEIIVPLLIGSQTVRFC